MKRPAATHRIELESYFYDVKGKPALRWTSHIIRIRGGKTLWSSTSQLYSHKRDAENEAKKFLLAAKAGKVQIVA